MALSRQQRTFLIVEEVVGSSIVNFSINGAIAWYLFRSARTVPLWGWSSIAADTLGTAFILPVLTALFAGFLVRRQVKRGKLAPISDADRRPAWARRSSFVRGALLGLAAMVLAAAPVVLVFALVGPASLSPWGFIWFKASFAAGLGALVTPLLGWWALLDASCGL